MSTRKRKSTVDNSDDEEWKPQSTSSKSTRNTTKKASVSTATKITKKASRRQTKIPKARLCSVKGCNKQVQQGGVCCKHGAKTVRALCRHEDCTNVAKRGGLCRRHGAFKLEACSHAGCKRVAIVGAYCNVHKTQHSSALSNDVSATISEERDDDDIAPPPKKKKVRVYQHTICIRDGCHNKADDTSSSPEFCTEHDNAKPKSVSVTPDPVTPNAKWEKYCIEVGCTNLGHHRGGVCRKHRQVKTVTPTPSGECENVILCNHEGGCMNKAVYDGVCVEHGAMRRIYASAHTSSTVEPPSQEGNDAAVLKEEARATPEVVQESEGVAYEEELDDVELDFLEDMYQPLFD